LSRLCIVRPPTFHYHEPLVGIFLSPFTYVTDGVIFPRPLVFDYFFKRISFFLLPVPTNVVQLSVLTSAGNFFPASPCTVIVGPRLFTPYPFSPRHIRQWPPPKTPFQGLVLTSPPLPYPPCPIFRLFPLFFTPCPFTLHPPTRTGVASPSTSSGLPCFHSGFRPLAFPVPVSHGFPVFTLLSYKGLFLPHGCTSCVA